MTRRSFFARLSALYAALTMIGICGGIVFAFCMGVLQTLFYP